jgi:hypothetical protein
MLLVLPPSVLKLPNVRPVQLFSIFMIFGATLRALGFWMSSGLLRWQALVLLPLTPPTAAALRLSSPLRYVHSLAGTKYRAGLDLTLNSAAMC